MHDYKKLCCTVLNPTFFDSSYHFHIQLLSEWHLKLSYCQPLIIYPKGIQQFIGQGCLKWFNMCSSWWPKNPILEIYTLSSIVYGTHYPFHTFSTHFNKSVWLHSNAKSIVYPHLFKIMWKKVLKIHMYSIMLYGPQ